MKLILPIILSLFIITTIPGIYAESVPDWVKNTAGWWATDAISEKEFVNAIEFLANDGIISIKESSTPQEEIEDFFNKRVEPLEDLEPTYNSYGLRGPEFTIEKPQDVYRIIAVGGSTTFGNGVNDEFTWPFLLEKTLNELETSKKIEVINGATDGILNLQKFLFIKEDYVYLNPDLIILYEGANDLTCYLPEYHNDFTVWTSEDILVQCGTHQPKDHSFVLSDRFSEICEIGKDKGFKVIIILQPLVDIEGKILTDQELESFFVHPAIGVMMDNYDEMIETVTVNTQNCIGVHDFSTIFDDYDVPLFFDRAHVGSLANTIISEHIRGLSIPILLDDEILSETPINLKKTPQYNFHIGENLSNSNFSNKIIENESFFGYDLSESDFSNSKLKGVDLRLSNLEGVDFSNSELSDVKLRQNVFRNADFTNVDFTDVDLTNVDLSYTDLSNVDLSNKDLRQTFLHKSDLNGADLSNSDLSNSFLHGVNLSNANLSNANFVSVDFTMIENKDLRTANVFGSGMGYSDLRGVNLPEEIKMANFSMAKMNENDLSERRIIGSVFAFSEMQNANLQNSDLSSIIVDTVLEDFGQYPPIGIPENEISNYIKKMISSYPIINIIDVKLVENDLHVKYILYNHMTDADLKNANLSNADLTYADLTNADLTNANLSNANLKDVYLLNANLEGANLEGANLKNTNLNCINHEICD